MKRIITFMMALALILSLGVTAFATDVDPVVNGTITVSNALKGSTYSVYKIFDATYTDDGNVTYSITDADPFFTAMFGADGKTANDYFVYHAATGVVTRNEANTSDADLFAYLKSLVETVDNGTGVTKTAEDQEIKFTGLDAGYYVIKSENAEKAVAVSVTAAKPDAVVNDKNNLPGGDFTKEFENGTGGTANVGDIIKWNISFTAVNYSKEKKVLSYTIKDNLTPDGWAAINLDSIEITVDGQPLEEVTDWTFVSKSTDGFEINIPWVDDEGEFIYDSTVSVEVTYNATVLEGATNQGSNKNSANMQWDLEDEDDDPSTPDVETETDVYNLGFTKVDGTNGNKLSGATFELTDAEGKAVNVTEVSEGVYVYDAEGSNVVVTPAGGAVVIKGLKEGTYKLTETVAPDGYNPLTEPVEITVVADEVDKDGKVTKENGSELKVGDETYYVNHAAVNVENFTGVELPSTGGKGTMMMITFGTMVAIAFAVLMITQKKMSVYTD